MSKTSVITARIDTDTLAGLDKLAEHHDRSRAWLVSRAVAKFVQEESAFFAFLQEGQDAIDRGDFVTHEELIAELKAMAEQKRAA